MDIVLATINARWIHPALALRLLKANLGVYEDHAVILEFRLRQPLAEQVSSIIMQAPRILGLSVSIWNHKATLELLEALLAATENAALIKPIVVLGGPEASHLPEDAALFQYADWVVRGDGELVFRELCAATLNGEPLTANAATSAVAAAFHGKFIDARPVDVAAIKSGYRLYTGEDLRQKLTYVETSRGCPFTCAFCLSACDDAVRNFPLEHTLAELDALIKRGARSFKFLDRTFNLDNDRAATITHWMLERLTPGIYVHFEMVPRCLAPELRGLFSRFPANSLRLEVGIQTFNPRTSALINRSSDIERELETLRFLRQETRAIVHVDLIVGLPDEDMASFARGFDQLWQVRPTEIQVGILKGLPDTPILRLSEQYAMRYALEPPYEVMETAALSAPELERLKNFARWWELIVNRAAFPGLVARLFPECRPVFSRFMRLADQLLRRFGRNWGIDRAALWQALEEAALDG